MKQKSEVGETPISSHFPKSFSVGIYGCRLKISEKDVSKGSDGETLEEKRCESYTHACVGNDEWLNRCNRELSCGLKTFSALQRKLVTMLLSISQVDVSTC